MNARNALSPLQPVPPREQPLTGREVRRFSRHTLLPEFGDRGQRSLLGARVAVVGAGGLGSPILQYLAAAGVGSLTVFDPDVVDESNLQRQVIHTEGAVGELKISSAARAVHALNSATALTGVAEALTPATVLDQLAGHDLVLDGTDNFPTRYLVSDACEILNIPLVWGSILSFHGQVSVFFGDSGRGPTYRDMHPVPPRPGEVPSCSQAGVIGTLVGVIGSTMAMEAVKVLSGVGEPLHGRVGVYDALRGQWDYFPLKRNPARAPVREVEDLVLTCGFPPVDVPDAPAAVAGAGSAQGAGADNTAGAGAAADAEILTAQDALAQAAQGRRLIDIREPDEAAGGMLPNAKLWPMARLLAEAPEDPSRVEGAIIHCQGGARSAQAQAALAQQGIRVADLAGGYAAAKNLL